MIDTSLQQHSRDMVLLKTEPEVKSILESEGQNTVSLFSFVLLSNCMVALCLCQGVFFIAKLFCIHRLASL